MGRKVKPKEPCGFSGCQKHQVAKGLCSTHWAQQRRHGRLWAITTHETPLERFMRNIKKDLDTDCWVWMASGSGKFYDKESGEGGYGQLRIQGESWMAHRWAYVHIGGNHLENYEYLDHMCRNTRCCNPAHLEKVTREENNKRAHLYMGLRGENQKLKQQLKSTVSVINSYIKGKDDADVLTLRLLCEKCGLSG